MSVPPAEPADSVNRLGGAPLIDSHCHLQSLEPEDREAALDEARERGVSGFLVPATRLDEAVEILDLCRRHPDVWCALGVHPHDADSWRPGDDRRLAELLEEPDVVAVGECGLDFHYDNSPRDTQLAVFRRQMELAIDADLPVVVHNRSSDEAMLDAVLRDELAALRADFHSFAGSLEMARALIERDFYLGVTGMVTFKKADNIREILAEIPPNRLLVETDTPYLAPVPYRGRPNRPAYVVEVAEKVADLGGEKLAEVGRRTAANFTRLFQPSRWASLALQPPPALPGPGLPDEVERDHHQGQQNTAESDHEQGREGGAEEPPSRSGLPGQPVGG